jgi:hypothetical protein
MRVSITEHLPINTQEQIYRYWKGVNDSTPGTVPLGPYAATIKEFGLNRSQVLEIVKQFHVDALRPEQV